MDSVLKKYPKEVSLSGGPTVTLRPLEQGDAAALLTMFTCIPNADLRHLRDDVTDRWLIDRWVKTINVEKVFPLVAVVGDAIVGDATLHRSKLGAARHIGEIRIVIHPDYRNKGLGTMMIRELIGASSAWGLEKVIAELVSEEQSAIRAFLNLGFQQVAVLPDFFKTENGANYDKVILTYSLVTDWDAF
jgi:RimJ/RimL family protein N-acetyltransferase